MLKVLTILIGILIVVSRGVGVILPETARGVIKGMLKRKTLMLLMMVAVTILGALILWGFDLEMGKAKEDLKNLTHDPGWKAGVMLAFGVLMVVLGLIFLAMPGTFIAVAAGVSEAPALTFRLVCGAAVVLGALILILGIMM